ncbi:MULTISPECIES: AMP-binding protein [unclassified Fibrobacter]|uniref:AMP-binding protein n=1 Tax=unclassified Fibrobacter TaxID=2634177 RepID=UPI000917BD25|nr:MULTISPECIES: AMP-binding protein [Fibrobacter]MCQ2098983.1 AMP-binding protein [Fibrobacter sp.]MCL4100859.1 D-alanine--D-alanyl carrier protein ligase [Fibrobacter succinogenes]OWV08133.1 AMP-dependent synthetase [Fibrobacter sp. UWH3]OWV15348.1 AMP-dependent synthetase [Fibrobacter sp. UWH1]SHK69484.1 Acyl-coenzyme A synthetase/AMP-(fatty) acid ligase [Fibrobacter sp. UWH6]
MKSIAGKVFFTAISVLYPVLVFCGMEFWGLSPRRLSILLLALAFYQFLNFTRNRGAGELGRANSIKAAVLVVLILVCGVVSFFADNILFLKFYPVLVNLSLLAFFGFTLWKKPSFVFRMANLGDKTIKTSPSRNYVERYCDRVTFAWCIFFVANACVSATTVFVGSDRLWSLYNGLFSYILIGVFFAVEFLIRKIMQSKLQSYVPVCDLELNSRPEGAVVSFDGESVKTWSDFTSDVSKVRSFLESRDNCPWILHCEDSYFFVVALLAMLQSGRKALVTANRQDAFIKEIKKPEYGFITDEPFGTAADGASLIQDILKGETSDTANLKFGKFDKSKAEMVMYTSGTTGEPKAVFKLFLQFENELFELVKVFGNDWVDHKVYSTVNHHHIYGLLFSVLLPIATGLPFRRRRIDFPQELAGLVNEKAVIASSPAYLKRLAADSDKPFDFKCAPIIYSSGGPLPKEVAERACELTGYWTMEIYGSTETGGIAYRQSKNGPVWTPFEVCKMSLGENDCLNIKSSYILEPDGFTTGDLVDIYDDGRFLLKGRSDSIVKIEEKRISLPEVENRLKQTGLVQDVRVVPMVGKRQYLAAAIVLNAEGREKFAGSTKLQMNNFFHDYLVKFIENTVSPKKWRYLEELPQNTEGKIRMRDVQALFGLAESPNFRILKFRRETGVLTAKLIFPATSDYYDGHFPEFKLLPAVVQVDMVLKLARNFLDVPKELSKIHRTKFANPIFPDTPVNVKISYDEEAGKVSFNYTDELGEKTLSNGSFTMNVGGLNG